MGALEGAVEVLTADGVTDGAEGFFVEPVAVGVELVLGEIVVVGDFVVFAEFFGVIPGRRFHSEALDM